ncbi:MAG: DNA repair protein RadA [SAR202 cluster bacterium]|nr:DNA repair protein RadA [SAR202 cluster bacterium]
MYVSACLAVHNEKRHTFGMAKSSYKTRFECSTCGRVTAKWVGKCSQCEEWNTVEERIARVTDSTIVARTIERINQSIGSVDSGLKGNALSGSANTVSNDGLDQTSPEKFAMSSMETNGDRHAAVELSSISTEGTAYMPTGISEFDRVLGGGFVSGSSTLLAGDPGIGKSTLLLQVAAAIADSGRTVIYATGEESLEQIRIRATRLGVTGDRVFMVGSGDVLTLVDQIAQFRPVVTIVDSIQTAAYLELDSPPGTVSQIRECTSFLSQVARSSGTALVLSGHVTKDGNIAGPRVLEHQVDAVLQMSGDKLGTFRMVHGAKNRFGPTDEIGVFEMRDGGLSGIADPSSVFIHQRDSNIEFVSGSAVALIVEGTRSIAVEVQALATPCSQGTARRVANGVEMSRVHLIIAVLAKHMQLPVANYDLVISVAGGLEVKEPAADLAIALAIVSSMMNRPIKNIVAVAGEIGLSGELRKIPLVDRRISEAVRLGFKLCIVPQATDDFLDLNLSHTEVIYPKHIDEAIRFTVEPSDHGTSGSSMSGLS